MKVEVISKENKIDEESFQPTLEVVVKITLPLEAIRDDISNGEIAKFHRQLGSTITDALAE